MKATDRYKMRRDERRDTTDVFGEASQDVSTYLPMAANILSEVTASQLKKKEAEEAKKKLESSDAYKAQQDAERARKLANDAAADALTEQSVTGPKHLAAQQAQLAYLAAAQKAAYYGAPQTPAGGVPQGGAMVPHGESLFTTRNVLIGAGALGALGLIIFLARR